MSILNTFLNKISRRENSRNEYKNSTDGKEKVKENTAYEPLPKYIDTIQGRVKLKQFK